MKKSMIGVISSILILSLTGCVSDKEYKDLEARVSYLESQLGVDNSNSEANQNADESDADANEENVDSTASDSDESQKEAYTYYIDSLSTDEIVSACEKISVNIPSQGQTYESYLSSFDATPVTYSEYENFEGGAINILFRDENNYEQPTRDAILEVDVEGVQKEMDGTIGHAGSYYQISTDMVILDYDKAVEIYDKLFNSAVLRSNISDINDDRASTSWKASCHFQVSSNSGYGFDYVSMNKLADGYRIKATYIAHY